MMATTLYIVQQEYIDLNTSTCMTNFHLCFFQDPDFFKQYHHFRDKEHENVSQFKLCYYPPVGEKGKQSQST